MNINSFRNRLLFRTGAILACFTSLTMTTAAIALMFGIPTMGWMVPFGFLLAALLVALAAESGSARITLYACSIALVGVVLCTVLCGVFVDFSYDGNTHHKEAVVFLAQGWNPLRESIANWPAFQTLYPEGSTIQLWLDHYARGPWLYGAAMYDLTGWIEAGKSYTLVMMVASGCMLGAFLSGCGFSGWQCILLALLAAINPITVPQFITFYNDAFLMMSLFLMLLSLYAIACDKPNENGSIRRICALVFACMFTSCVQIKFSGLAYAGLFSVAFLVVYLVQVIKKRSGVADGGIGVSQNACADSSAKADRAGASYTDASRTEGAYAHRTEHSNANRIHHTGANRAYKIFATKRFLTIGILMLGTLIVSVCVVGYSPYITNYLSAGHPFYPLMGEGAVDIMTPNSPAIFADMNTLQKELVSLFSQLASPEVTDDYELSLKVPLSISFNELRQMPANDSRICGFGLLYSAIAIVNFLCVIPMLIISRKRWPVFFMGCVAYYACVVALMFIFSDGWWARYSGYRYFSNIILLAFMLKLWNGYCVRSEHADHPTNCPDRSLPANRSSYSRMSIVKFVTVAFSALLVTNTALFLVLNTSVQYIRSCALNGQLIELGQEVRDGAELHLASENQELGLLFNLDSMGIRYTYDGPITEDFISAAEDSAAIGNTHRFLYRLDLQP